MVACWSAVRDLSLGVARAAGVSWHSPCIGVFKDRGNPLCEQPRAAVQVRVHVTRRKGHTTAKESKEYRTL